MNNNILQAVTQRDLEDLKNILESGWYPPRDFALHSGTFVVYSVWTETIVSDWVDGFQLLDEHFPEITLRREIWELILRSSSINCLKYVWDKTKERSDFLNFVSDQEKSFWVQSLMHGMGDLWSPDINVREVIPVIEFFRSKGFALDEVYTGEYEPGNLKMSGHSLWTRALFVKRWDIVDLLWPSPSTMPTPWEMWPRISEVLLHILQVVVGDYQSIAIHMGNNREKETEVLMRWLKDYGSHWVSAHQPALSWPKEVQRMIRGDQTDEEWEQTTIAVSKALSLPTTTQISPWFRLPLYLKEQSDRQVVWNIWLDHLRNDPNKSWLHQLAIYPVDEDVKKLLELMKSDNVGMDGLWSMRNADGLSAADVWKEMCDQEDPFA